MKEEQYIEDIDRYLSGEMSAAEAQNFESRLATDAHLREELAQYKLIVSGLKSLHAEAFLQNVSQWENKIRHGNARTLSVAHSPKRSFRWQYAAAAIALIAVSAAGFFFVSGSKSSPDALFAEAFETPENYVLPTKRTDNDPLAYDGHSQLLINGMNAYDSKDFGKAVRDLKAFMAEQPEYRNVAFYLGVSLLHEDMAIEARDVFKRLQENPAPFYEEHCDWYLALTYLKLNELNECKTLLSKISSKSSHHFRHAAEELLNKL